MCAIFIIVLLMNNVILERKTGEVGQKLPEGQTKCFLSNWQSKPECIAWREPYRAGNVRDIFINNSRAINNAEPGQRFPYMQMLFLEEPCL